MIFIGLDIGGANIKAVKVLYENGSFAVKDVVRVYNPIWILGPRSIASILKDIRMRFGVRSGEYYVGASMTAELSDVFVSKDVGVMSIAELVESVFSDSIENYFVSLDMDLKVFEDVLKNPMMFAASNWVASAWLLERIAVEKGYRNIVFVDIGSTTTTIIPIVDGKTFTRGYTDPEKLVYGELVYTGVLRTNVCAIVDKVPYKGFFARVSSERFALSGDVHLVLGYIKSDEYSTETADGRGRSFEEAVARIARVPCADAKMLSVEEVIEIARYIYEVQVFKVFEALMQIRSWLASQKIRLDDFKAIVAGIGKHIAVEACRRAGFREVIDIDDVVGYGIASVFPSYAVAAMVAEEVLNK
ncbi:MAG: hydantoinase/oxoprolinase family protein [Ignisphaera sp.]